jgi:hypothetical protein
MAAHDRPEKADDSSSRERTDAGVDRRFAERCDDALETTEAVPCRP